MDCGVGKRDLRLDREGDEHRETAAALEAADMLSRHDRGHAHDRGIPSGMNAPGTVRFDGKRAHMIEALNDGLEVGGARRLRPVAYPGQFGTTTLTGDQKSFKCGDLASIEIAGQPGESRAPCLSPRDQRDAFECEGCWQDDA